VSAWLGLFSTGIWSSISCVAGVAVVVVSRSYGESAGQEMDSPCCAHTKHAASRSQDIWRVLFRRPLPCTWRAKTLPLPSRYPLVAHTHTHMHTHTHTHTHTHAPSRRGMGRGKKKKKGKRGKKKPPPAEEAAEAAEEAVEEAAAPPPAPEPEAEAAPAPEPEPAAEPAPEPAPAAEEPPAECPGSPCVSVTKDLGNYVLSGTLHVTLSPEEAKNIQWQERAVDEAIEKTTALMPEVTEQASRLVQQREDIGVCHIYVYVYVYVYVHVYVHANTRSARAAARGHRCVGSGGVMACRLGWCDESVGCCEVSGAMPMWRSGNGGQWCRDGGGQAGQARAPKRRLAAHGCAHQGCSWSAW